MKAKMFKVLKSKFGITTMLFFLVLTFFDSYSLIRQYNLKMKIQELEKVKSEYIENIADLSSKIETVENDKERVARERYFYKKADEELFIIQE